MRGPALCVQVFWELPPALKFLLECFLPFKPVLLSHVQAIVGQGLGGKTVELEIEPAGSLSNTCSLLIIHIMFPQAYFRSTEGFGQ